LGSEGGGEEAGHGTDTTCDGGELQRTRLTEETDRNCKDVKKPKRHRILSGGKKVQKGQKWRGGSGGKKTRKKWDGAVVVGLEVES